MAYILSANDSLHHLPMLEGHHSGLTDILILIRPIREERKYNKEKCNPINFVTTLAAIKQCGVPCAL